MNPLVVKPGETIYGIGLDFACRLAQGETAESVVCAASDGITVLGTSCSGTQAMAVIRIADGHADAELTISYTVTGSGGSIRKGTRDIWIRANSN